MLGIPGRQGNPTRSRQGLHEAYLVCAAVAVAGMLAALAALVNAGFLASSPGADKSHGADRRGTLERQSPAASVPTAPPDFIAATPSLSPSPGTAEAASQPVPPCDPAAVSGPMAQAEVPARPSSNSRVSEQVSSGSSPAPSGAPAPPAPSGSPLPSGPSLPSAPPVLSALPASGLVGQLGL
jgi:hypothetical protein